MLRQQCLKVRRKPWRKPHLELRLVVEVPPQLPMHRSQHWSSADLIRFGGNHRDRTQM
ncbi:hypothetical protein H6G04_30030 [Calothrix membranacea FACHB-236]|nr:hypothetical protein [Calothrix membranacea FACHB-236]